jgi:hypothetical protein
VDPKDVLGTLIESGFCPIWDSGSLQVPSLCRRSGHNKGPIGGKSMENPVYEKPDYWVVKPAIPKHGKRGVENHAKGGYHAALSNAVYP